MDPATAQPTDKQRRHCLSPDHVECSTFRAARQARISTLAGGADPELIVAADHRRRPLARTAPILLESPRLVDKAIRLQFDRAPGQLALVGLMVVAFAIVALTRFSGGAGPAEAPSPVPSAAIPSQAPTPLPTLSAPPSSAGPSASPSPSAGPLPSARTTYRVKKGDTLLGIASHFGTSAAKIRQLNGLTTNILKIGQVLKIP